MSLKFVLILDKIERNIMMIPLGGTGKTKNQQFNSWNGNGLQKYETITSIFHQRLTFHTWDTFSEMILSLSTKIYHQICTHDILSIEEQAALTNDVYQPYLFTQNIQNNQSPFPNTSCHIFFPLHHFLVSFCSQTKSLTISDNLDYQYSTMREVPKLITEDELLANLQTCLADLSADSKQFQIFSAIKQNIELRRENMRILRELESVKKASKALLRQRAARKRRTQRRKARKLKIRMRAMRRLSLEQTCQPKAQNSRISSTNKNPS